MAVNVKIGCEPCNSEMQFLESLSLPSDGDIVEVELSVTMCPFCELMFDTATEKDLILKHLLVQHRLVIADVNLIADLHRYISYWKKRFSEQPLTDFCSIIKTNSQECDIDESVEFYLLCDSLPEDRKLRIHLQRDKLERVLADQQRERDDLTFSRSCLFCKTHFTGKRGDLFNHMLREHNFNIGQPDNLVYTDELLDLLKDKLHTLSCLYCEKTFKDRHVLKEHMRKKLHKKIKPGNTLYDKYYIINYLELGKNWESLQKEQDEDEETDQELTNEEWSDWTDKQGATAICLFCDFHSSHLDSLVQHMQENHQFNLPLLKEKLTLTFYQQIKLINFIRRRVHQCMCVGCDQNFSCKPDLIEHMESNNHIDCLTDTSLWDQPQYYFPTYENDNLLCILDDDGDGDNGDGTDDVKNGTSVVIAEDLPLSRTRDDTFAAYLTNSIHNA